MTLMQKYFYSHFVDETFLLIKENIFEDISSGKVSGNVLIDISIGASANALIPASRTFKEIHVVDFIDSSNREFEKWLKKEPGYHSFSYAAKVTSNLEGGSEDWHATEDRARQAVKDVIKWDLSKDDHQGPLDLPQADCVLSLYMLEAISKDKEAFQSNLNKITSRLKTGGHLILVSMMNTSFLGVGKDKLFVLSVDDSFVTEALTKAGLYMENSELILSPKSSDLFDFNPIKYVRARKERNFPS
ncbi:nicotinamide N-methyltransferase-like [Pelodytes ibericus]